MSDLKDLTIPLIASIVAACAVIVVRGTKVSEFRQLWINDQRSDIAEALSRLALISAGNPDAEYENYLHFKRAYNRICLRENPIFPEWQDVIHRLDILRHLATNSRNRGLSIESECNEVLLISQRNLKREWTKVRTGEWGYRIFTVVAVLLAAGSAFVTVRPAL